MLFAGFFLASIAPIRSYDFFWHLATGRWIVEHRLLPEKDPFTVASDPVRWNNGEWLFQVALYGIHRLGGDTGISILRGLLVAALFTLVFLLGSKRGDPVVVALLTTVGWYAADHRLTMRPETVATFFVVAAVWLALGNPSRRAIAAYGLMTAVWFNIHPSALLAPFIAGIAAVLFFRQAGRWVMVLVATIALFINPYGIDGVTAPLHLMRTIGERKFVNVEWLPSSPLLFPVLPILAVVGIVLFLSSGERRREIASFVLFLFFGFLAFRHLRNQGFFFAAAPILLAPFCPRHLPLRIRPILAATTAGLWLLTVVARLPIRTGVDRQLFPVDAVARLRSMNPAGNIYNPDQFGGYLIWTFYPERRVLTDGRNELYSTYLAEYERARANNRDWNRLVEKYDLRIAVEEYRRDPVSVIDAQTGQRREIPASLVFFPRNRWALVGFDPVGMVFVRRDSVPSQTLDQFEIRGVIPDGEK